jgi:hypothetical protein
MGGLRQVQSWPAASTRAARAVLVAGTRAAPDHTSIVRRGGCAASTPVASASQGSLRPHARLSGYRAGIGNLDARPAHQSVSYANRLVSHTLASVVVLEPSRSCPPAFRDVCRHAQRNAAASHVRLTTGHDLAGRLDRLALVLLGAEAVAWV